MATADQLRRLLGARVQRLVPRLQRALVPAYDELLQDRDRALSELRVAFESLTAAHQGIADLQAETRSLRDRLDATLLLAEAAGPALERVRGDVQAELAALPPRLDLLEDGLHEARRLNLRIAELTDVVTELVLPLHDRDIDAARLETLRPDAL